MKKPNQLVQLNELGIIHCHGPDAEKFIQGQLTCDAHEVNATFSLPGAHCDRKGRVIANFRLAFFEGAYLIIMPKLMLSTLINSLKHYAMFSKVTLCDESPNWSIMGLCANSTDIGEHLPISINSAVTHNSGIVIRVYGQTTRHLILNKNPSHAHELQKKLEEQADLLPYSYWELQEIKSGIAYILPNLASLFTPQMLNLQKLHGVSFDKGCYIGQEIIARTEHLGHLKRHLYLGTINTETPPEPGCKIVNENDTKIGVLVNISKEEENKHRFLAVVQDAGLDASQKIVCSPKDSQPVTAMLERITI
jgi:folate-binding protein YgfZ